MTGIVGGGSPSLTIGTTAIVGGTTTRILYDNAGTVGEYTLTGSGTVAVMQTGASLITPALGVASGTSIALGGATIGSNALAVTGITSLDASATTSAKLVFGSDTNGWLRGGSGQWWWGTPANPTARLNTNIFEMSVNGRIAWDSSGDFSGSVDLSLARLSAANLRQGAPPSATPVAQTFTLGEASRPATDTNIAGASGTIQPGNGTGNATPSSLVFQVPVAVASGTGAQTMTTLLTLNGSTQSVTVASGKALTLGNAAVTGLTPGALAALTTATIVITDSAGQAYRIPCVV